MKSISVPSEPSALAPDPAVREAVSAWMDQAAQDAPPWLHGAQADQARAAWDDFHCVGDVLRAPQAGLASGYALADAARVQRVRQAVLAQLQSTPQDGATVLDLSPESAVSIAPAAPNAGHPLQPVAVELSASPRAHSQAANAPLWRWRVAAAVATVVATGSLLWNLGAGGAVGGGAQLAQAPSPATVAALPNQEGAQALAAASSTASSVPAADAPGSTSATVAVATQAGVMIRDPRLDELLAAHRQHGGASALQLPTGFLRAATFEGGTR